MPEMKMQSFRIVRGQNSVGNLSPAMGARNQLGIRLSFQQASLCSLATQFQTWFLVSIPRPMWELIKFLTQVTVELG
jgi:hypothetical protein